MKIILSPAKAMNPKANLESRGEPAFLDQSKILIQGLKKLNEKQISKLMNISQDLGQLNHKRFEQWQTPFKNQNSSACVALFNGPAYQGLDYSSLSKSDQEYGNECLRILSGLYGILLPLEAIAPYRLEMGLKYGPNKTIKSLYRFWDDQLLDFLNQEFEQIKDPVLINLASSEYFRAVKPERLNARVITPIFKDKTKSGQYKTLTAFVKRARGLFARFIIVNRITKISDLKKFDLEGYRWSKNDSSGERPVFLKR